jgi:hypothetical protein
MLNFRRRTAHGEKHKWTGEAAKPRAPGQRLREHLTVLDARTMSDVIITIAHDVMLQHRHGEYAQPWKRDSPWVGP